ncbi:class I SAM-dependent RNA methyltransferase [uncultured Cetobacterium sp.]|uniref:THUMP domain-containing class I SAM-dependent RNA methyltransferase n=2 Tax=Cetobacterium sp. TaxID=2071632 RepID=UPI0025FE2024|nr:class I SAM-dependent RNA methyltransferase [uncultured Cetobacterium sp.]
MKKYRLIASATMGLESVVKDECKELGFENVETFNGRVEFDGDEKEIVEANLHLRCADRVFIKMGEFKALTFDNLFENIKRLPWENIISADGEFPISWVSSVKCKLFSKSDIQKIVKKAIVERLRVAYQTERLPETGGAYRVKIQAHNDIFLVMVDTSGEGLHKRGYRNLINEAPLKETMAAALVLLSRWKGGDRPLIDPMCGTGTIAIEAAMIARNVAPGVNRNFASEKWPIIPENLWVDLRDDAFSREDYDKEVTIYASDIDEETVEVAKLNAKRAGVDEEIEFRCMNFLELENTIEKGCIVTNPPYGDRLLDEDAVERLYGLMGDIFQMRFPRWSYYIITSYENFEKTFGKKATKNRKLYNGGIKCHYYQYYGAR